MLVCLLLSLSICTFHCHWKLLAEWQKRKKKCDGKSDQGIRLLLQTTAIAMLIAVETLAKYCVVNQQLGGNFYYYWICLVIFFTTAAAEGVWSFCDSPVLAMVLLHRATKCLVDIACPVWAPLTASDDKSSIGREEGLFIYCFSLTLVAVCSSSLVLCLLNLNSSALSVELHVCPTGAHLQSIPHTTVRSCCSW